MTPQNSQGQMPLNQTPAAQTRKRKRKPSGAEPITPSPSQPSAKRRKAEGQRQHRTPSRFWDNLSRVWLTPCALREFDRRTVQPVVPIPPELSTLKETQITKLKLFARHGGPNLTNLRAYPEPAHPLDYTMSFRGRKRVSISTSSTRPTTNTTATKNTTGTGPYDPNFQQKLIDGCVYPDEYEYPDGRVPPLPDNWGEINQRLAQRRPSLSPSRFSDGDFRKYKRADAHVSKENKVTKTVIPIIEGEIRDDKCVEGEILYTNLDPLTNDRLKTAKPDLYYGARPEQLDRKVREKLSGHIIPSRQDNLPIVPNFFLAAKGPDGSLAVAGRQACYDGAFGARGMHSLRSYGQGEPAYDNTAYTITSIYYGGILKMYTSHLAQPAEPNGRPSYYMTQLRSFAMTDTAEAFRQGASAFRNARDWTKEERDNAIARANEKANEGHGPTSRTEAPSFNVLSSFGASQGSETLLDEASYTIEPQSQETSFTTDGAVYESETSTDELSRDIITPAKRSSRHSRQSQRKKQNTGKPAATASTSQSTPATAQESER